MKRLMLTAVVAILLLPNVSIQAQDQAPIMFWSDRDGDFDIYLMTGSDVDNLTQNDAGDAWATWSPDGARIAFESDRDGHRKIYVMNADGSDARSFTDADARDTGPVAAWRGKRLPQRPARQLDARLDWSTPRLRVGADLLYLGDDALDRYNRYREASRTLAGAAVSFAPRAGALRFTLEGKNLGDRRVADVGGFPLPGRSLWASIEYRLGPAESASMERN